MKAIRAPRTLRIICSVLAIVFAVAIIKPRPAQSAFIVCEFCAEKIFETEVEQWISDYIGGTYWRISRHMRSEFVAQKVWFVSVFWEDNLLPALMLMANQLSAVATQQMEITGAFLDAKQQLETQQVLQRIAARTHKDYQLSDGLCEFGSGIKSLGFSDHKGDAAAIMLSQRSQDRQLGAVNTAASMGEGGDKENRIKQFREKFCDPKDNNDGLNLMCDWDQDGIPGPLVGGQDPMRFNKDINYRRTIDEPWTVTVDMIFPTLRPMLTDEEEEVLALASNLYGHDIFIRPPPRSLQSIPNERVTNMQKVYLDMRSIVAKLSVAENSFNNIVGLKAEGTAGGFLFLRPMLMELGLSESDATLLLGSIAPSYDAQMKMLTSKIFQNPDFYTNLYDTPANVERKKVAMQAIGLMQKFDLFRSHLRAEASLSVILELANVDLQKEIENEINQMVGEGD